MNPHDVTRQFEKELCSYTGAPFAVAVNSCTMALTLAVAWCLRPGPQIMLDEHGSPTEDRQSVEVPKRTYVSVPQAIIHAGGRPTFRDVNWFGMYQLRPLPVWDSARWFTSSMYDFPCMVRGIPERRDGEMICVSFHASKTLGIEQGGAILHDNPEADAWFRRARFDGRTEGVAPKDDHFDMIGWHCYMNPSTAAQGILRLHSLPMHNAPLPNDVYPDLSKIEAFR